MAAKSKNAYLQLVELLLPIFDLLLMSFRQCIDTGLRLFGGSGQLILVRRLQTHDGCLGVYRRGLSGSSRVMVTVSYLQLFSLCSHWRTMRSVVCRTDRRTYLDRAGACAADDCGHSN